MRSTLKGLGPDTQGARRRIAFQKARNTGREHVTGKPLAPPSVRRVATDPLCAGETCPALQLCHRDVKCKDALHDHIPLLRS
jgi:hypothetical protein